jgi:hypothetical protein
LTDHLRYLQFVHPRLPVLSLNDLSTGSRMDIGLKSATFALAASFLYADDEFSVTDAYLNLPTDTLWTIARRRFQLLQHCSRLASLQLCLLLLQRPPRNLPAAESPHTWEMACSSVAIAESQGLNIRPSNWHLPQDEVILRRRLWLAHIYESRLASSRPWSAGAY